MLFSVIISPLFDKITMTLTSLTTQALINSERMKRYHETNDKRNFLRHCQIVGLQKNVTTCHMNQKLL